MNIREQSQDALRFTIGDPNGAGTPFVLINKQGGEFPVVGDYGDIAFLLDPTTGSPIQTRTITAAYPMASLAEQTAEVPDKGWTFRGNDLQGKEINLFVTRYEPDRTIGIAQIRLAVKS